MYCTTLYAAVSIDTQEASPPVASGENILLVMSTKCSGLTRRQEEAHWWHVDSFDFCPFTVVGLQYIVGYIMYNKQIVWPWTSCFLFVTVTVLTAQKILTGFRFISTKNKNYSITETKDTLWDAGYSTVTIGVQGGRTKRIAKSKAQ